LASFTLQYEREAVDRRRPSLMSLSSRGSVNARCDWSKAVRHDANGPGVTNVPVNWLLVHFSCPVNGGAADVVDLGQVGSWFTIGQALAGLGTLRVVEAELRAHLDAVLLGDCAALAGALDDALALILGHGRDERHETA